MEEEPISRVKARTSAVMAALHLIVYYGAAVGLWGLALKMSLILFVLVGAIIGLLISLLFVSPVVAMQRTKEKARDMMFAASSIWGGISIIIGVLALVIWIIRVLFFK